MPAKYRAIQTCFWNDSWVIQLTPEQKFFFIYLLTNPKVSQCGIYEISLKQMEFETGYNKDTIEKLLKIFEKKGKIRFSIQTSEICIPNFSKYNYNSSPKVRIHIIKELNQVKDKTLIQYLYGIDTIYKGYVYPRDTVSQEKQKEKEKEKQKQKQKDDGEVDEELGLEVLKYFGFNKTENAEKYDEILDFISILEEIEKIEFFRQQFESYKKYKVAAHEKIHGFKAFLGELNENFQNGGWCAENWSHKLKEAEMMQSSKSSEKSNEKPKLTENYQATIKDHAASSL